MNQMKKAKWRGVAASSGVALVLLSAFHATMSAPQVLADDAVKTTDAATTGKWVDLFDGKDLDGWVQHGGKAQYRVQDGAIVGSTVPNTSNSFLCTTRDYTNFILEFEFKVDPTMNSGVQFRSSVFDTEKVYESNGTTVKKTVKVPAHRVHGYQYEIDPSKRAWSAGLYDEGRRAWLQDLTKNPDAQKAFKQNEWNKARIVANGAHIQTWLNGVPAADLQDDLTLSGFIALQVHAVGAKTESTEVMWRNIRLQELPATPTEAKTDAK